MYGFFSYGLIRPYSALVALCVNVKCIKCIKYSLSKSNRCDKMFIDFLFLQKLVFTSSLYL